MPQPQRSQISAFVSDETRQRLERYVQEHGMKKAAVIERALLHHLHAMDELPADIVIPPRLLLGTDGFEQLCRHIDDAASQGPTEALVELLEGNVTGIEDPP